MFVTLMLRNFFLLEPKGWGGGGAAWVSFTVNTISSIQQSSSWREFCSCNWCCRAEARVGTVDKTDYDDDIPVSSIDFDFDDREERADDAQVLF